MKQVTLHGGKRWKVLGVQKRFFELDDVLIVQRGKILKEVLITQVKKPKKRKKAKNGK